MSNRILSDETGSPTRDKSGPKAQPVNSTRVAAHALHQRTDSSSSRGSSSSLLSASNKSAAPVRDYILLTPYPVEPGHTLITILRLGSAAEWKPEMRANAAYVAEGDNAGIVINKPASIMDYNKIQAGQKERQQPPSAKMSFKVFLINSETNKLTLEHRTLRFWLDHSAIITPQRRESGGGGGATKNNGNLDNNNGGGDDGDAQFRSTRSYANLRQEASQLAQAYFCRLIGSKPDDFPKAYVGFIMKLMRLLKEGQFARVVKMEVEMRQLAQEDHQAKPPSPVSSIDGSHSGESGRGSPLTSQRVLDIIESSYPNPISIREICSSTQTEELIVRQLVDELATREKINSTDDGQHFTRTTKVGDGAKVQMVKQMPMVARKQQPVIAIITAQYCEKLAVDSMISDKETFVRYRAVSAAAAAAAGGGGQSDQAGGGQSESSSNYVYTLGNIGDHRVVSTKLTSIGHSRGALIAAGNATTRLLGTFPEIEYVFLVGCGGGVPNYSDFASHVRLGDIVVSHLPGADGGGGDGAEFSLDEANLSRHLRPSAAGVGGGGGTAKSAASDFVYVHCRPKVQEQTPKPASERAPGASIPVSYSVHRNLKRAAGSSSAAAAVYNQQQQQQEDAANCHGGGGGSGSGNMNDDSNQSPTKAQAGDASAAVAATPQKQAAAQLTYEECHFRLWRPAQLDLQQLAQRLWLQGLDNAKHRIWDYYIDEGIKALKQHQDIEAQRPPADSDKLYMSIGSNDTIEVSHPEAADDELDLRREGRPMCHFGPIGSGKPALANNNEPLKQQMISEFNLRAFDSEFDPVVESIYGNCKESYIMIRGISDYKDGRKRKEWQQYSALVAAAFMKSIIVNLKPR